MLSLHYNLRYFNINNKVIILNNTIFRLLHLVLEFITNLHQVDIIHARSTSPLIVVTLHLYLLFCLLGVLAIYINLICCSSFWKYFSTTQAMIAHCVYSTYSRWQTHCDVDISSGKGFKQMQEIICGLQTFPYILMGALLSNLHFTS